jgi:hypothetical protein
MGAFGSGGRVFQLSSWVGGAVDARAVLALRTFKKGQVGYEIVNLRPGYFCPYLFQHRIGGSEYVPMGLYQLSADDLRPFQEHAKLVFADLHSSLQLACTRLGDVENRLNPRDAIIDAVIGLESILLAQTGKEAYRGEMRYRFAINYSTFFENTDERYRAFLAARSMYDLRSTIAHGGRVQEQETVGDEKLTLYQIAERACDMLRSVVKRYLPSATRPEYASAGYWEKKYFELPQRPLQ